jgi:hypothetical protein
MNAKIVWILGTGFTQPLGGPMLNQLLSPGTWDRLGSGSFDPSGLGHFAVFRLFHYGRAYKDGRPNHDPNRIGIEIWRDAEDFVDYLDAATEIGGPAQAFIAKKLIDVDPTYSRLNIDSLRFISKQLVAAECCAFLRAANPKTERWQPFREWARRLDGNDVVITFNYDRVIEILRDLIPNKIEVVDSRTINAWDSLSLAKVLKLHGSVDWQREETSGAVRFEASGDPEYALTAKEPAKLAIATPGPSKQRQTDDLKPFWDRAKYELESARAVVFVGYRFPPTDAQARSEILGALRENPSEDLYLHIVLGPDDNADARRLYALLEQTMRRAGRGNNISSRRRYHIQRHPLFSQDFIGLYTPNQLLGRT